MINQYLEIIESNSIKHISFDLWLTIIKSNPNFKPKRNIFFREYFKIDKTIEEVNLSVRKFDVLINNMNERTGLNVNVLEIYYLILNDLGKDISLIDKKEVENFIIESSEILYDNMPLLIDDNIHLKLKEIIENDISCNILSNTGFIEGLYLRKIIEYYDLSSFFLFQIYSDECGYSKPNNLIFQLMYDKVNTHRLVQKCSVIHIGDNITSDYNGAINFGINAKLI